MFGLRWRPGPLASLLQVGSLLPHQTLVPSRSALDQTSSCSSSSASANACSLSPPRRFPSIPPPPSLVEAGRLTEA